MAHIRRPPDADHFEVLFLESARIYELPEDRVELLERLRDAEAAQRPVKVALEALDSDVIEDVQVE